MIQIFTDIFNYKIFKICVCLIARLIVLRENMFFRVKILLYFDQELSALRQSLRERHFIIQPSPAI